VVAVQVGEGGGRTVCPATDGCAVKVQVSRCVG